jgi:hypothetical protein
LSPTALVAAAATALVGALADADADGSASPRAAVAAADSVSNGRRILYQCLIDLRWVPPPGVLEGMALDSRLAREGLGAGYDGPPAVRGRPALLHCDVDGHQRGRTGPDGSP